MCHELPSVALHHAKHTVPLPPLLPFLTSCCYVSLCCGFSLVIADSAFLFCPFPVVAAGIHCWLSLACCHVFANGICLCFFFAIVVGHMQFLSFLQALLCVWICPCALYFPVGFVFHWVCPKLLVLSWKCQNIILDTLLRYMLKFSFEKKYEFAASSCQANLKKTHGGMFFYCFGQHKNRVSKSYN